MTCVIYNLKMSPVLFFVNYMKFEKAGLTIISFHNSFIYQVCPIIT